MTFLSPRALVSLALASCSLFAAGCANQTEGERCDTVNGSADCETGLYCKPLGYIAGASQNLCCPISGPVTVAACNASGGAPPSDAGTAVDGATDAEETDAEEEAGADAEDDGATDDDGGTKP
jgi:hypothetical protein